MAEGKISSANYTDMTNQVENYESDASTSTSEIEFQDTEWDTNFGIYNDVPLLKALIDRKAIWTVGKGFKVKNAKQKSRLDKIRGNGFDTFNIILQNAVRVYTISEAGFFAEIMKTKQGELLNLKPLNPSMMKIIADAKGIIIRFEQWDTTSKLHEWKPEDMFFLPYNRIADSIHGQSTVKRLKTATEAYKEAKGDMRTLFHRYVKPLIISIVDTDDTTEIAEYKQKLDKSVALGENMVVPKGTLDSMEKISIPEHSTLDPLPWIAHLEREFLIAEGVPAVLVGSGEARDTEAEAKVLYLAFQQLIEWNQMFIEEQCKAQLGIEIELEFPASLEPDVQENESKSRDMNNQEQGIGKSNGGTKK
jgi:hypothetical protein